MKFWIDFFVDRRYSLRFKLADIIMGDTLRNYLTVGCLLNLNKIIKKRGKPYYNKYVHERAVRTKNIC